ncbi:MAG: S46 family peptidase [Bacteroidetes bacterium]|nr:S46 family peptidase [Bacteroidota bacterium]MBL7104158.1 S46 family peptidase [Bacteroidales bacterium]
MKKLTFLLFGFLFFTINSFSFSPPDEGMWLPMFVDRLNYVDMQEMGLQLTAEEIYSINNSSLKDAIVGLSTSSTPNGYFCTGGIVSDKGLLFTNHHCGYDIVQQHSSLEHDYLADGFWAMDLSEELPNEELTASFLIRMDNVTDSIIPFLSDTLTEADRRSKIRETRNRLKEAASEDGKHHVVVKSFFGGNEYYLFVYEVYEDVRLVGAPPSSIGKFGGDTDNWMWPRHTGDFTIFRVYSAPDGSPAKYSEENVPLNPKHFIPVSIKGVEKDDFAMIWGYPGGTNRYMTSYGVQYNVEEFAPALIDLLGKQLEILKEDMDVDREVKIKYASNYAGLANGWKYFIGQSRGVKKLYVIDKKKEIEKDFTKWVNADEARKEKYGDVLNEIEQGYDKLGKMVEPLMYINLGLMAPGIVSFAQEFTQYQQQLEDIKENPEAPTETAESLRESAKEHFKDYNAPTDKKILAGLYQMYANNIPEDEYPDFFKEINKKYKGDFNKYADYIFEKSIFTSEDKVNTFLDNPSAKKLVRDPALILAGNVMGSLMAAGGQYRAAQTALNHGNRLFIAGLREMNPDKVFYPDANSTLRLSYGSVLDYYPADAVHYDYITHLSGVMEKEDPDNDEFIVPAKLKELYEKKDYGRYGKDGKLIVGFLTTNDITGGNSGSPVINGNGELIGLAFDGNWEAMSGDIAFEPELQRTICVDSQYILFIIDKFAGAQNLIDELTIIQ